MKNQHTKLADIFSNKVEKEVFQARVSKELLNQVRVYKYRYKVSWEKIVETCFEQLVEELKSSTKQ